MGWVYFALIFVLNKKTMLEQIVMAFFTVQMLYSIYIGGDTFETMLGTNRLLTIVMPVAFILITKRLKEILHLIKVNNKYIVFTVFCLVFVNINMVGGWKSLKMYVKPNPLMVDGSIGALNIGLNIKDTYPKEVVVAVQGAGIMPYFSDKKHYIDLHGVNDKFLAHSKITGVNSLYDIFITATGHTKYNQEYSIIKLKPDIIVHPIKDNNQKVTDYIRLNYSEIGDNIWALNKIFIDRNNKL
jgi:hypothetical protein